MFVMRVTRTELFWLAALWLCNVQLERDRAEATRLFDAYYADFGEKLWAAAMRPSLFLVGLEKA